MLSLVFLTFFGLFGLVLGASTMCYCKDNDKLYSSCRGAIPCGQADIAGYVQCCAPGDACGADGFCHFTHPQNGTSGYYLGSCTDPSFRDSSCPQTCTDLPSEDVVYNATSGLWACCYGSPGVLDCSNPGRETFQAKPPEELFATPFSLLSSTITVTTSVSSTTIVASSTQVPISTPSTNAQTMSYASTGLSTGAKIAIGVVVTIVVVAALTGAIVVWLRKTRNGCFFWRKPVPGSVDEKKRRIYEMGVQNTTFVTSGRLKEKWNIPEERFINSGLGIDRRPLRSELPAHNAYRSHDEPS